MSFQGLEAGAPQLGDDRPRLVLVVVIAERWRRLLPSVQQGFSEGFLEALEHSGKRADAIARARIAEESWGKQRPALTRG